MPQVRRVGDLLSQPGDQGRQAAAAAGKPIAAINLGRTRADELLALKVQQPVGAVLHALAEAVAPALNR